MRLKRVLLILLSLLFMITGCEFGGGGGSRAANEVPLAVVAETQSVTLGSVVTLDGSASTDPENSPLSYSWNFTSVAENSLLTDADITGGDSSTASFTPDKVGQYSLQLSVSDGTHENTAATVITVNESISVPVNVSPVADAGSDMTVPTGSLVNLNGSNSSDADGDDLTFQWNFISVPAGSSLSDADITGSSSSSATFTPDIAGEFSIKLSVSDAVNPEVTDEIIIKAEDGILVSNTAPTADAGNDQSLILGDTADLDGSASSDPDGDPLSFAWTFTAKPAGSSLTDADISGADADTASFVPDVSGTWIVNLAVDDGINSSVADQTAITVSDPPPPNTPPTANAGADISLTLGGTANLDGSASSDPDGDALSYAWSFTTQPAGSALTDGDISGADTVTAAFVPDVSGTWVLTLTVNDGVNADVADQTTIVVNDPIPGNDPPTADAGTDQALTLGDTANLDGSASSDPDGDALSFVWTFSTQPAGSALTAGDITGADTDTAAFVPDVSGTWVLTLTVNDGVNSGVTDQTAINVSDPPNDPPTADAGADQALTLGDTANLDGSASNDPDGDALSYAWSFTTQPAGSALTDGDISGADTDTASFVPDVSGTWLLTLTVNDGVNSGVADQTTITVSDPPNDPPTADAGTDQALTLGDTANLDGSASSDPDGDALSYAWSFTTQPAGSALTAGDITGADTDTAAFVPDVSGTWVLTLTVNDGVNSDVTAQTTITVTDLPPVPEITVLEGGTEILNGNANYNLGNHSIGTVPVFTFTIRNDGTADLNLSGTPVVVFSANDPEYTYDCSLTDSVIAPGGSTTFTVTYTPQVKNVVSYGTITIVSDDSDEGTTTFTFRARAKN